MGEKFVRTFVMYWHTLLKCPLQQMSRHKQAFVCLVPLMTVS